MFNKKTIKDVDVTNKRVLARVDFNVPLDSNLNVTDNTRIRLALPTINYLMQKGAKIILMSHLGEPSGKRKTAFSLKPVSEVLSKIFGGEVFFFNDCVGKKVENQIEKMKEGEIAML